MNKFTITSTVETNEAFCVECEYEGDARDPYDRRVYAFINESDALKRYFELQRDDRAHNLQIYFKRYIDPNKTTYRDAKFQPTGAAGYPD
jgi:hypothetical protein